MWQIQPEHTESNTLKKNIFAAWGCWLIIWGPPDLISSCVLDEWRADSRWAVFFLNTDRQGQPPHHDLSLCPQKCMHWAVVTVMVLARGGRCANGSMCVRGVAVRNLTFFLSQYLWVVDGCRTSNPLFIKRKYKILKVNRNKLRNQLVIKIKWFYFWLPGWIDRKTF